MVEPWRYKNTRIGWTKIVDLDGVSFMLRCFESRPCWSAAVYRGTLVVRSALVPGSYSRHETKGAAQRELLGLARHMKVVAKAIKAASHA